VDGLEKDVVAKKIKSSLTFHLTTILTTYSKKIKHHDSDPKKMMWWLSYFNLTWIVLPWILSTLSTKEIRQQIIHVKYLPDDTICPQRA
jgi:hypothetical protein